jgi:ATP adenylyltransferase/5',5'''-P-1,P-4-tetraphosphate phosphorylase II
MALLRRALECSRGAIDFKTAYRLFLPETRELVVGQGLSVVFHYFDPSVYTHHPPIETHTTNDPLLPPYPPHIEVAHLLDGADHYVFVNRGMIVPGHVVISHASPRAIQGDDLDISDCHAMAQVLRGCDYQGIAYYNAGRESGCSQMHKHMQFAPLTDNPLFEAMRKGVPLPWRYCAANLRAVTADELLGAYRRLRQSINHDGSYNVVVSNGAMAVVPRRRAGHLWGVNVNSLGVSGHFFLWKTSDRIIEQRPLQILRDLCVPV